MTGFTTDIFLSQGSGGAWRDLTLTQDLTFVSSAGPIVVPAGFVTDGASVPRILWAAFSPVGRWLRPATVHDLGCTLVNAGTPHPLMPTRAAADRVFHEAMLSVGTNRITAWLMFAAVRVAGIFGRRG